MISSTGAVRSAVAVFCLLVARLGLGGSGSSAASETDVYKRQVYAAQHLSFERAVEQYAITGGVPKYLEFFNDQEGLLVLQS